MISAEQLQHLQGLLVLCSIASSVVMAAAATGGAYAAVKAHLRALERRCDELRGDVDRAHVRIDSMIHNG